MNKKIIMTVSGIRPDFIRMSEIFKRLDEADWCEHILVHTGQHYDTLLSDVFFNDLKIRKPDHNLTSGQDSTNHYDLVSNITKQIIPLARQLNPDLIIFLGDSNSVLCSIPLKKEGFKICHIEAGMRSGDMRMLEEINRKCCDIVSDILFVYHENYKQKALREGISEDKIHVVGNTICEPLEKILNEIKDFNVDQDRHILLDIHRPENFLYKDRMQNIIEYSNLLSTRFNIPIKMLNFKRTLQKINEFNIDLKNIELIDLMGYKNFITSMKNSKFIISDSGTAQEEPAILNKPVLVPRDYTERPESVENNCSIMIEVDNSQNINKQIEKTLNFLDNFNCNSKWLYTNEATSYNIHKILKEKLNG